MNSIATTSRQAADSVGPLASGGDAAGCGQVRLLFADIDDTMTTRGEIPRETFDALWAAREGGLRVVPVTGRPAGWCDHLARMWPIDGVIGENGAFYFRKVPGGILRVHAQSQAERSANRERLEAVRREVLAAVPGCAVASDQAYREYDLAVDFCEDVPRLDWPAVERIVAVFRRHGATAKVSSIHVNGWFGSFDKCSMARRYLREVGGVALADIPEQVAFVGDSPNDEPMFEAFRVTFGVANIRAFLPRMVHRPAAVVDGVGGAGFAQVVMRLIEARKAARRTCEESP